VAGELVVAVAAGGHHELAILRDGEGEPGAEVAAAVVITREEGEAVAGEDAYVGIGQRAGARSAVVDEHRISRIAGEPVVVHVRREGRRVEAAGHVDRGGGGAQVLGRGAGVVGLGLHGLRLQAGGGAEGEAQHQGKNGEPAAERLDVLHDVFLSIRQGITEARG